MEIILDFSRHFATLSGVLTGFSFSAVILLLPLNEKRIIVNFAIISFFLASLGFLYVTFNSVIFAITVNAHLNETVSDTQVLKNFAAQLGLIFSFSTIALLIGLSLSIWIRSKVLGIVVLVVTMLALFSMLHVFTTMNILYPPDKQPDKQFEDQKSSIFLPLSNEVFLQKAPNKACT